MQGQYPKGVCYIVDGQGGCRGSIPKGSAVWSWTGRRQGQYPKGVCKWSMDRTEEGQYTTDICAERMGQYTTWCLNNGQWNHWML